MNRVTKNLLIWVMVLALLLTCLPQIELSAKASDTSFLATATAEDQVSKDDNSVTVFGETQFIDVPQDAFYAESVDWAVEKGITNGTSTTTFSPDTTCTRGQVVTFLWRTNGLEEPKNNSSAFLDIRDGGFYQKAVLWAVENEITAGTSATTFSPDGPCTRGQVVTFLWRAAGKPSPNVSSCPFTDVSSDAFYYQAVLWASENNITSGITASSFAPEQTCTRGQIVTFLYRAFEDQAPADDEPLMITKQPKGETISEGETVTLAVIAFGGTAPYSYQWKKDGTNIPGATSSIYQTGISGKYTCTITDAKKNNVTSEVAVVIINSIDPLIITSQPQSTSIVDGTRTTLSVSVSGGTMPYSYQWYANGIVINGANSTSYTTGEAGSYTCTITDSNGKNVSSNAVQVSVYADSSKPYKIDYKLTDYNTNKGDSYIGKQFIDNSVNPKYFGSADRIELKNIACPGYEFLGWFTSGGTRITEISTGTTTDLTLFARWQEITYDITYKLYQTPLGEITNDRYLHYTVNKGLMDLPNPTLYNYVFMGWYLDDGTEVKNIPAGTTGDIILNAYWTSKRNLTKKVQNVDDPFIFDDSDNGVLYFTYEIGTIENVPLSDAIWTIQSVAGLAQQKSQTISTTISQERADAINRTISNSTVDSATWTLSEDWNDTTQVSEEWASQHGMTQEEANTQVKSSSNTYSITSSSGGKDSTSTTNGTTALKYGSKEKTDGSSAEAGAEMHAGISDLAGTSFNVKVSQDHKTKKKTGTDKTKVKTTVSDSESTWNSESSNSSTKTASESSTISKAMSETISNSLGYGKSYSSGGGSSETQGFSQTSSDSVSTSSTLTYFTSETTSTTTTYSTDGKSEGCYRLVIAGTIHVFGVVGYDIASKSYFAYTFNVLDDKTYEFLDYSPNLSFDDYENGVIPFEVPYFVNEYVSLKTSSTQGLLYKTNSQKKTAEVVGYTGSDADILIPSYITSGNVSYQVTSISANAFAGKPVRAIILSDYIDVLPAGAFKGCTALEEISGCFYIIGEEAFNGCVNLEEFMISSDITSIGANAFAGVPQIKVEVLNSDSAINAAKAANPNAGDQELRNLAKDYTQSLINEAVSSGAERVILDASEMINEAAFTIVVPNITSFELLGGRRTFSDLKVKSQADTTIIRNITIKDCKRTPLEISSPKIILEAVAIDCPAFALLASSDNVNVTLVKDNTFVSGNGKAVVWKEPVLKSEIKDNAIGVLDVSGNVYTCGSIRGNNYCLSVTDGEIISISESDFANYIKGSYIVTFNANGGAVSPASKTVYYGQAYGELPTPTRQYYTFAGWYTAASDGEKVTKDSYFNGSSDMILYARWTPNTFTLTFDANGGTVSPGSKTMSFGQTIGDLPTPKRDYYKFNGWFSEKTGGAKIASDHIFSEDSNVTIYAQWTQNEPSAWVLASSAPSDAQIVERKWSYTQTYYTTDSSPSRSGWTQYKSTSAWSAWGSWSGWQDSYVASDDYKNVESRTVYAYYYYQCPNCGAHMHGWNITCPTWAGGCGKATIPDNFHVYWSTTSHNSAGFKDWHGTGKYYAYVDSVLVFKWSDGMSRGEAVKTQYRYRTRSLVYTYYFYRTESKESSSYPSGSDISDIKEWVRYRAK